MNNQQSEFQEIDKQLLLSLPEAAQVLRISRWTLNRLVQSRALCAIRIGTRRLVPATELKAYVRRQIEEEDEHAG